LRDMLQQFRHLFDHLVFGQALPEMVDAGANDMTGANAPSTAHAANRLPTVELPPGVKSIIVVETPAQGKPSLGPRAVPPTLPTDPPTRTPARTTANLVELWEQEIRAARRQLEPDGALTGATRELQAGLGQFLAICHEHGAKVGPWRLQHVVG